jgi:hypothetical protein
MGATFCAILTAYLLGRFVLPLDSIAGRTRAVWPPLWRGAALAAASYLLLGAFDWKILLVILLTFLAVSAIKEYVASDSNAWFLWDHGLHFIILAGIAYCFPEPIKRGWWTTGLRPNVLEWYFAVLSCISGVILCVPAGGVLIARLIKPFTKEIGDNDIAGLARGGQYIGWLERILVMLLVLMDQPNGIGFLIAAKSILRFGEIKDATQRKVAEYIIIGTFLSFGWALLISVLTRKAIQYWTR